jgi:hypothetical protein
MCRGGRFGEMEKVQSMDSASHPHVAIMIAHQRHASFQAEAGRDRAARLAPPTPGRRRQGFGLAVARMAGAVLALLLAAWQRT